MPAQNPHKVILKQSQMRWESFHILRNAENNLEV